MLKNEKNKKKVRSAKSIKNLNPIRPGEKRAEKTFDKDKFEALCKIHCTQKEILDVLGFKSHDTLNAKLKVIYGKTFEEVYPEFQSSGKMSLRRLQYEAAQGGNTTMLIWLGKQYLGQSDKQEIESNSNNKIEIIREIYHREVPKKEG